MQRWKFSSALLFIFGLLVFEAAYHAAAQAKKAEPGWTTIFDGKDLSAFNMIGDAVRDVLDPETRE